MSNKAFIIDDKSFGETVKSFRTAKKLTERQLADLMGMDTSYYSKLEAGKLSNSYSPGNRTIEKFCKVLELNFVQELTLWTSAKKVHPKVLEKVLKVQKDVVSGPVPSSVSVTQVLFGYGVEFHLIYGEGEKHG